MISTTHSFRNRFGGPVRRFVASTFVPAMVTAGAALTVFVGPAELSDWWWVAAGGLVVAYGQGALVVFRFRRERSEVIGHEEALFPILLMLLGPAGSVLAWCLGTLLHDLMARRAPIKMVFNVGLFTLGSGFGAAVTVALGGPSESAIGIVATLVGAVAFSVSMSLIFSGLMARLEDEGWWRIALPRLAEDMPKNVLEILLGVLVAVAVKTTPVLAPVAVAVLLVVTRAYRQWFSFDSDRKRLQDLLGVANEIQASTTVHAVESALTEGAYTMTAANSRVVRSAESSANGLAVPLRLTDGTTWTWIVERDPPLDRHDRSLVETLARIGSISFATAILLEERQETSRQLEALVRSKEDFLMAFAHEIRTPLTAVNGFASILSSSPPDSHQAREAAEHILEQSLEMTHLVDNLLVAARANTGEMKVTSTTIDLRPEVERFVNSLPSHRRPTTAIPDEPCTTVADPIRVRQILRNLILNAFHHGGETVTITVGFLHPTVYVEVRDDGRGIDDSDVESIFLPFEHRHRIPGRPGSLGLGLSVSRLLARRMEGDVTYERSGAHTVFVLHLPAAGPTHNPRPDAPDVSHQRP